MCLVLAFDVQGFASPSLIFSAKLHGEILHAKASECVCVCVRQGFFGGRMARTQ